MMHRSSFVTPITRLATSCCLAAALLCGSSHVAAQPQQPVTSEGFESLLAESTLYTPIPLDGVVGFDCPPEAVHAALKAAAENPAIEHAVFMINSEEGWLLENEHIGVFRSELTITAVIRDAVAPAIFPVFFADNIFMMDNALVGGLPLHEFVGEGSEEVAAKQVGILSSMLASAAQARGHSDAVAYAMIDKKKKLYAWRERGKLVLSNNEPGDKSKLRNFREIKSALPGSTLTLDHDMALEIGFAKSIDSFDHFIVGEYLDQTNWTPANQFGRVCNEIGSVIGEIEPLRDNLSELDKAQRDANGEDSPGYRQYKKALDDAVEQLDIIKEALESVYETHPERHIYFAAPDGRTIVADAEKWREDYNISSRNIRRASGELEDFTKNIRKIGADPELLYDLNKRMELINEHLMGIQKHGNAAYWADHAKPDLPDDVYG